jgi:predicted nuclease of predicted toxin-antitoxin system
VKILLDEMLPKRLGPLLIGHEVWHVATLGWRHIGNGKLLSLAESEGFEVLLTKDGNMPHQQNMAGRTISLVILRPEDQNRSSLLDLAPGILRSVTELNRGSVVIVASGKSER